MPRTNCPPNATFPPTSTAAMPAATTNATIRGVAKIEQRLGLGHGGMYEEGTEALRH